MLKYLESIDLWLFFLINGLHSSFLDFIMFWISNKWIWIPFYAYLFYIVIKYYKNEAILVCLMVIILITVSDQLSSAVIKNWAMRLRPCHDSFVSEKVHLVNGYCGGMYGFVSSHASNSFALMTFFVLYFRNRFQRLKRWLLLWAIAIAYSRIYLGVHYPGDVIGGALLGCILGFAFVSAVFFIKPQLNVKPKDI